MLNLINLLKEKGYKKTPLRVSILEIFIQKNKPISADFIYKKLEGNINEATVYRTLSSFQKAGIIRKIELKKNSSYFELDLDHHHHIVCTKCETIEEFKDSQIEKVLKNIIKKSSKFNKIKEHSLELFGLCTKCSIKIS